MAEAKYHEGTTTGKGGSTVLESDRGHSIRPGVSVDNDGRLIQFGPRGAGRIGLRLVEENGSYRVERCEPLEPGTSRRVGIEHEFFIVDKKGEYTNATISETDGRMRLTIGSETFELDEIFKGRLTPEAFNFMIEVGTLPKYSPDEAIGRIISCHAALDAVLAERGYRIAHTSVATRQHTTDDITSHPYIQEITGAQTTQENAIMPHMGEFGNASVQFHVEYRDPEDALRVLHQLQRIHGLIDILTAAGPIRDGRFDTTLGKHYCAGDSNDISGRIPDMENILPPELHDVIPQNWRYLSRVFGSPSGGTITHAYGSMIDYLMAADEKLSDPNDHTLDVARTTGWHTDRLRPDIGTVEFCASDAAGGNFTRMRAVGHLLYRLIPAMEEYARLEREGMQQPKHWLMGLDTDSQQQRQQACEDGKVNAFAAAIGGRQAMFYIGAEETVFPNAMMNDLVEFIGIYGEKLPDDACAELMRASQPANNPPDYSDETDYNKPLEDYFEGMAACNAGEALRRCNEIYKRQRGLDLTGEQANLLLAKAARVHCAKLHQTTAASLAS